MLQINFVSNLRKLIVHHLSPQDEDTLLLDDVVLVFGLEALHLGLPKFGGVGGTTLGAVKPRGFFVLWVMNVSREMKVCDREKVFIVRTIG